MKVLLILLMCLVMTSYCQNRKRPGAESRSLMLSPQELRFAGHAIHSVLSSSQDGFRSRRGNRRFSGTFTIVEQGCGVLDIRVNADVELLTNVGNRNQISDRDVPIVPASELGNGYAGRFNY